MISDDLHEIAMALPDTSEGVSCKGTVLESRTIKVDGRAFLFLGKKDARLKLEKSIASAKKLAAKKPAIYSIGAGGWTKIALAEDLPLDTLDTWIRESHALIRGPAKKSAKKKTKKR
jgi:predicted DNA-binding protein (MmcQ/YjbR family)